MHANSSFEIRVTKCLPEEMQAIAEFVCETLRHDLTDDCDPERITKYRGVEIEETYEVVWLDDIVGFAADLAQKALGTEFFIRGLVDCSENSGEYQDFNISYQNRMLIVSYSDWYCCEEISNDSYDEYLDEHSEDINVISEEDFEKYYSIGYYYCIEDGSDTIADSVPLTNVETVFLDAGGKIIDKPAWES